MAATEITPVAMTPIGVNLTDATFSVLSTGVGNGVKYKWTTIALIVLKNTTGGAATFTIKSNAIPTLTNAGLTTPNIVIVIAAGKSYLVPPNILSQDSSLYVTIECDVAGSAIVYYFN